MSERFRCGPAKPSTRVRIPFPPRVRKMDYYPELSMDQSPFITSPGPITVNRAPELRRGQASSDADTSFFRELIGGTPWRRFKVLARHIENGKRGDGKHCAIALAWKEAYPDDDVDISGEVPVINGYKIPLTVPIVNWVEQFDSNADVPEISLAIWNDPALTAANKV